MATSSRALPFIFTGLCCLDVELVVEDLGRPSNEDSGRGGVGVEGLRNHKGVYLPSEKVAAL